MLDRILENKKISIERKKTKIPISFFKKSFTGRQKSIIEKINQHKFIIIAETKKVSPSAGIFRKKYNPAKIAVSYVSGGASAISVLTEEKFFLGSIEDLKAVKNAVEVPVLAKDFFIDEYQIYEVKHAGADCVLLILRILSDRQFLHLFRVASSLGLEILIEIHNEKEMERLSSILPDTKNVLLGINSRDLDSLNINHDTVFDLLSCAKNIKIPVIAESGVKDSIILKKLYQSGVDGVLIGEYLLRSKSPGEAVKKLLKEIEYERDKDQSE